MPFEANAVYLLSHESVSAESEPESEPESESDLEPGLGPEPGLESDLESDEPDVDVDRGLQPVWGLESELESDEPDVESDSESSFLCCRTGAAAFSSSEDTTNRCEDNVLRMQEQSSEFCMQVVGWHGL